MIVAPNVLLQGVCPMSSPAIQIPGYSVLAELGRGGMATVYLARQESLNRKVAIKILRHQDDEAALERFINEAHFIASLNNPHVITIYDIATLDDGRSYIVMEYLSGGDLRGKVDRYRDETHALSLLAGLARGLAVVHRKGIVHRDIKPANILFRDNGDAVLTDFGIAKNLDQDADLTQAGFAIGSPSYSSPEQVLGRAVDMRSDIYSLGVVLVELLLGRNVFKGEGTNSTAINHVQAPVPTLPDSLVHLQPLVNRMLAKQPNDRFENCTALIAAIEQMGPESSASFVDAPEGATTTKLRPSAGTAQRPVQIPPQVSASSKKQLKKFGPWVAGVVLSGVIGFSLFYESDTDKK